MPPEPEPGTPLRPPLPPARRLALPTRGTTFVHEVPGPPGAPTLVLLHGWQATAAINWFACFEPLGRQYRVVALDQRGHGRGIRSYRPLRLEDCADDVAALADALGLDRIIPVGYSMGGAVAQLVWRRHPDRVDGLVLCATAGRFASRRLSDPVLYSSVLGISMAASVWPPVLQRLAIELVVGNRFDGQPLGDWFRGEVCRNDPAALLQAGIALRSYDARRWLAEVDVPTAVVVPMADTVVPPRSQLALANVVPGAEIFPVDGDHGVCARRPRRFVRVLSDACASVARRTASGERGAAQAGCVGEDAGSS